MLTTLLYSLLALDQTVATLATQYGAWLYAILFVVIFAETGLVVCPFLPGDSILFIAGTVVAAAGLDVHVLVVVLIVAAVLGDSVNYGVGHYIGPKVFHGPIRAGSARSICAARRRSTTATAASRSSSAASCRSSARSRRSSPASRGMSYRRFLSYNVVGGVPVDRPARLRRLPVRQHPVGQGEPVADRRRDRRRVADSRGDDVRQGAASREGGDRRR